MLLTNLIGRRDWMALLNLPPVCFPPPRDCEVNEQTKQGLWLLLVFSSRTQWNIATIYDTRRLLTPASELNYLYHA